MQDKDSKALRNQRKRRKRIGKIKSVIVGMIAGWMILSMVLIICLFVKNASLEKKLDYLIQSVSAENNEELSGINAGTDTKESTENDSTEPDTTEQEVTLVSGVEDADNLAAEGDVHNVYLTFDDGPSKRTGEILDILAEQGVKATFFVTGKQDEESEALYKRIVEEGHTLGMHSYSNKYSEIYQSKEAFIADYEKISDYLYEVTGTKSKYYRFPGSSSNPVSNVSMGQLIQYLEKEGVVYYDWNVSSGDAATAAYTASEIVENVTGDVGKYKTSVVLLHDSEDKSTTVEALPSLIAKLKEMKAQILPIDEKTQAIQYVKVAEAE